MSIKETDWTMYYKRKKSVFSRMTQRHTLNYIFYFLNTVIQDRGQKDDSEKISIIEAGGGNSCFAEEICKKIRPKVYDIIDNNELAVQIFIEKDLGSTVHNGFMQDMTIPLLLECGGGTNRMTLFTV